MTEKTETNRDSAHVAKQTGKRVCKSALILVQAKMSDGLVLCLFRTSGSAREARSWTSIVWLLCTCTMYGDEELSILKANIQGYKCKVRFSSALSIIGCIFPYRLVVFLIHPVSAFSLASLLHTSHCID